MARCCSPSDQYSAVLQRGHAWEEECRARVTDRAEGPGSCVIAFDGQQGVPEIIGEAARDEHVAIREERGAVA